MEEQLRMPAAKYIQQLSERIETALKAAGQNVRDAQQRNKHYYDKQSSERFLEPGDLALILLPTDNIKLTARWQGPYTVLRRGENNNYVLDVNGRQATLHINALRKYHQGDGDNEPTETVNVIINCDADLRAEAAGETDEDIKQRGGERFAIGEQLTADQRTAIKVLLQGYPEVFTDVPGCTHLMQHVIRVTDETPCFQHSYKIPEGMRDAVEEELKTMEKNGIIQYDPDATWNSPLIVVRKPNGKIRLVNNFIQLNKKTINEQHTMSRPEELVNRLAGSRYITRIDLRSAYHQCLLSPESRKYTAFQTPFGTYSYCRMAMGLKCASATCQRLIDRVLKGAHRYAASLIDDILVYSMDFDTHLKHVADILDRLRAAGLTANESKCIFATNSMNIFGHKVQDGKIYPDDEKTATIANWPVPHTKSQLMSFVGLTNYFRSYIPDYAAKAYPLTELLGKYKPNKLRWGPDQQTAFDELKAALTCRPVLRPPDMGKDMIN